MQKVIFLISLIIWGSVNLPSAYACKPDPGGSWYWTDEQLVEKAQFIFRVTVVAESAGTNPGQSTYRAKIEQVIKSMVGLKLAQEVKLEDFAPSGTEWKLNRERGRATYRQDCKPWTNFQVNQEYLIFLNSDPLLSKVFHPKAYEELQGKNDPWLKRVRDLVSQTHPHYFCKLTVSKDEFKTGESSSGTFNRDLNASLKLSQGPYEFYAEHAHCKECKKPCLVNCSIAPGLVLHLKHSGFTAQAFQNYKETTKYLKLKSEVDAASAICIERQ